MNKYIVCLKNGIQESLAFKVQFFTGFLVLLIPFAIKNAIWFGAFAANNDTLIAGYSFEKILTYNMLSLAFGQILKAGAVHYKISGEISSGELSKYLAKPVKHSAYWGSKYIGNKVIEILYVVFFLVIMMMFMPGALSYINFRVFLLVLVELVCALAIFFFITYNLSLLAFSFVEISSLFAALEFVVGFLSGEYIPLDIFPKVIVRISEFLPFSYGTYFMSKTLMGEYTIKEIIFKLVIAGGWICLLSFLSRVSWNKGLKRFQATGG